MSFEDVFNPGAAYAREELERQRTLPVQPPLAGEPFRFPPIPDVEIPDADEMTPFTEHPRHRNGDGDV